MVVVWIEDIRSYAVFVTTDMDKSVVDILKIYKMRIGIEEDFKITKYKAICFHLICILCIVFKYG